MYHFEGLDKKPQVGNLLKEKLHFSSGQVDILLPGNVRCRGLWSCGASPLLPYLRLQLPKVLSLSLSLQLGLVGNELKKLLSCCTLP